MNTPDNKTAHGTPPAQKLAEEIVELGPELCARLQPADGVHAIFIPKDAIHRAEYERMGYKVARRGDGNLRNEEYFGNASNSELARGDSLIGVISEQAYRNYCSLLAERNHHLCQHEGGGLTTTSREPIGRTGE